MAGRGRVGCILLFSLLMLAIPGGATQSGTEGEGSESSPLIIEWFVDSSSEKSESLELELSHFREDEAYIWIAWHPLNLAPDDPLASHDAMARAEELSVSELPALRINRQAVSGIDDGDVDNLSANLEIALNQLVDYPPNSSASLNLEVEFYERGERAGVDGLIITAEVTPHTNISNQSTLQFMIVEWEHVPANGAPRPTHVVREWMPRAGVPRNEGQTERVVFNFDAQYLDPADIIIEPENAHRWGIVAIFSGHDVGEDAPREARGDEVEIVLATAYVIPASKWQDARWGDAAQSIIVTILVLSSIAMVILSERRRELELPKVTGRLTNPGVAGNQITYNVKIEVIAGTLPAELTRAECDPPWKLRRAPKRQVIKPGVSREWNVDVRSQAISAEQTVCLHLAFNVEGQGDGWVMDLRLHPIPLEEE